MRALLFLLVTLCACQRSRALTPDLAPPAIDAVIARALPSVPLVIRYLADGTIGFGAGLVVSDDGLILTNLHVVSPSTRLGVMMYEEARTTYTVLEGGLSRFLFEQQDHIVSAVEVARDEGLDLALIRISQSTRAIPRLSFATAAPGRGDSVLALGHPAESLWSFSSGTVSSLPAEMVQHDALVYPGSSGGPLLDRDGRVIGLNTAMVKSARGAGYARPAALLTRFVDRQQTAMQVDLSTAEKAVRSCTRAFELGGMPDECMNGQNELTISFKGASEEKEADAGSRYTTLQAGETYASAAERAALAALDLESVRVRGIPAFVYLSSAVSFSLNAALDPLPSLKRCGDEALCASPVSILPESTVSPVRAAIAQRSPARARAGLAAANMLIADYEQKTAAHTKAIRALCGLSDWRGPALRRALQKGWRIVSVTPIAAMNGESGRAWVLIEGIDGATSRFQYAELWTAHETSALFGIFSSAKEQWTRRVPAPGELATLPKEWPPPLYDDATIEDETTLGIAKVYLELARPRVIGGASSTSRR